MTSYNDIKKHIQQTEEAYNQAMAHNKTLPKGLVAEKVFRIRVADGYAVYQVIKVEKYNTTVKHRPDLCLDNYRDAILFDGGSFPTPVIERIVVSQEKLDDLFKKTESEKNG